MFREAMRKGMYSLHNRLRFIVGNRPPQSAHQVKREWSISIYAGTSPLCLHDSQKFTNPVLTRAAVSDVGARFVADPFMIRVGSKWHMFFEVMVEPSGLGQIGLATSDNASHWNYDRIVLNEQFHLSYPYVFEWKGEYFMIPESHQAGSIRLYRAGQFPYRWSFVRTLLKGWPFSDPSVVHYEGRWWLFVETNPQHTFDTLRLFYSDELTGPWQEHPMSPIVTGNNRIARPAGRIQVINGHIIRFAQDCYPAYGTRVRAFVVSELTTQKYFETECQESPVLGPSGAGWNRSGMHHVDIHKIHDGKWIACVDGVKPFESS